MYCSASMVFCFNFWFVVVFSGSGGVGSVGNEMIVGVVLIGGFFGVVFEGTCAVYVVGMGVVMLCWVLMIMFFKILGGWGELSVSLFCVKFECYFCMVGYDYKIEMGDLCRVFRGKVFWIEDDGVDDCGVVFGLSML